jgi:hypothetical protein
MASAYTGLDSVGLYLSGGASNYSPADSLGGAQSSKLIKGMTPIFTTTVQGLIIEDATPENLEGDASISIASGQATYTPPDGLAGSAVAIAAGERKVLLGSDPEKAVRIYREAGKTFTGSATFALRDAYNGVFAMSNVPNADRVAGSTVYRAIFVKALQDVEAVLAWITTDGQSTYQLATEDPDSLGDIQTISDETTAPAGLVWEDADAESTAITIGALSGGDMDADDVMGLWIKRTFPAAGTVDAKEQVSFHLQFVAG